MATLKDLGVWNWLPPWGVAASAKQPWASSPLTHILVHPISHLGEKQQVTSSALLIEEAVTFSCSGLLFPAGRDHFKRQCLFSQAKQFLLLLKVVSCVSESLPGAHSQHYCAGSYVSVATGENRYLKTLKFVFYSVFQKSYPWFQLYD